MTYLGHVSNGTIVLDDPVVLPDGMAVSIEPLEVVPDQLPEAIPTLYERLEPFIGKAEGLPPDASVNHDHYLYGTPKRE